MQKRILGRMPRCCCLAPPPSGGRGFFQQHRCFFTRTKTSVLVDHFANVSPISTKCAVIGRERRHHGSSPPSSPLVERRVNSTTNNSPAGGDAAGRGYNKTVEEEEGFRSLPPTNYPSQDKQGNEEAYQRIHPALLRPREDDSAPGRSSSRVSGSSDHPHPHPHSCGGGASPSEPPPSWESLPLLEGLIQYPIPLARVLSQVLLGEEEKAALGGGALQKEQESISGTRAASRGGGSSNNATAGLAVYWRLLDAESRGLITIEWHPNSEMACWRRLAARRNYDRGLSREALSSSEQREVAAAEFGRLDELLSSFPAASCRFRSQEILRQCFVCLRPRVAVALQEFFPHLREGMLALRVAYREDVATAVDCFRMARLLDLEKPTELSRLERVVSLGGETIRSAEGDDHVIPTFGFPASIESPVTPFQVALTFPQYIEISIEEPDTAAGTTLLGLGAPATIPTPSGLERGTVRERDRCGCYLRFTLWREEYLPSLPVHVYEAKLARLRGVEGTSLEHSALLAAIKGKWNQPTVLTDPNVMAVFLYDQLHVVVKSYRYWFLPLLHRCWKLSTMSQYQLCNRYPHLFQLLPSELGAIVHRAELPVPPERDYSMMTLADLRSSLLKARNQIPQKEEGYDKFRDVGRVLRMLPGALQEQAHRLGGLKEVYMAFPRDFILVYRSHLVVEFRRRDVIQKEIPAWITLQVACDVLLGALVNLSIIPRHTTVIFLSMLVRLLPPEFKGALQKLGGTTALCEAFPETFQIHPLRASEYEASHPLQRYHLVHVINARDVALCILDYYNRHRAEFPELEN